MLSVQPYKCILKRDGRALRVADSRADCSERAAIVAHAYLGAFPHEEVIAILLSGAPEVIGIVKVAQGGLHGCAVTPADVLVTRSAPGSETNRTWSSLREAGVMS